MISTLQSSISTLPQEVIEMSLGYFFLFLVGALMPGFFLFNFFKDA